MGFEPSRSNGLKAAKRRAGELHCGPSGRQIYHPKVAEENAAPKSGSERLGARFLGGEAFCIGCGAVGTAFREFPLDRGEDAIKETVAMARNGTLDATDIDEIGADTEDHATGSESARPGAHRNGARR